MRKAAASLVCDHAQWIAKLEYECSFCETSRSTLVGAPTHYRSVPVPARDEDQHRRIQEHVEAATADALGLGS